MNAANDKSDYMIYNSFIGLVGNYQNEKIHVNGMEEATTRLEKIISEMKTADEISASQTAMDTETGKVVKKKKGTIIKTSSATVKALYAEWKKMAFLSSRTHFQFVTRR